MSNHIAAKIVFIYEFLDSENLFIFAENFFKGKKDILVQSELYKLGNNYRLCVSADKKLLQHLKNMSEFADLTLSQYSSLVDTIEYGKLISVNNPLKRLFDAIKEL